MADAKPSPQSPDAPDAPHGFSGLFLRLRDSARHFVRSEVEYVLADVGVRTSAAVPAIAMLVGAAALCFSALTAVLIGLIIAFAPYITIWGALALVTTLAAGTAFLLVKHAFKIVRVIRQPKDTA